MKLEEKASLPIIKIICVSIILVLISGAGVIAISANFNEVKIVLQNGYEISTVTSKTKVSDILEANKIVLAEDEKTIPAIDEDISSGDVIKIVNKTEQEVLIAQMSEKAEETSTEDLINYYSDITEKIEKEQKPIPFETITKEIGEGTEEKNEVLQEGQEGIKEFTYKVKYQKDIQIEKILLSEEVIKDPVNKIIQIKKIQVTSRNSATRMPVTGTVAEYQEYAKQRCSDYGWSDSDFNCLVSLWNRESKWNVTAENRNSGAYGIPQALPATKMSTFGSDYLTNYKTQIEWGLSYIKRRYITPTEALAHSLRYGWY